MTTQQAGMDAGGGKDAPPVNAEALDRLDDEGKTEEQLWKELDAVDAQNSPPDDKSGTAEEKTSPEAGAADEQKGDGEADGKNAVGDEHADPHVPSDKGQKPDPWATAPAEIKAEHDALKAELEEERKRLHAERSAHGREMAALRRQLNGSAPPSGKKPAGEATSKSEANRRKAFETQKGKDFQKEYPEVAQPVAEELDDLRSEVADLRSAREKDEAKAADDEMARQTGMLAKQHPDWQTLTANNPEFKSWWPKQPRHIREAVERNANGIVDAEEAADVVGRFKAFRSSQGGSTQQGGDNAQGGPSGNAEGKNGSSLSGKRQRQLESSSSARSSGPGAAHGIPEDGDEKAIWDAFERQDAARERAARRA